MSIYTTTPPNDDRLAALIAEAFEALPAPDRWRLKTLEERLTRQLTRQPNSKKPSAWAWWLAGALLAASAAASWWMYGSMQGEDVAGQSAPLMQQELPLEQPSVEGDGGSQPSEDAEVPARERAPAQAPGRSSSPLIYQRETP